MRSSAKALPSESSDAVGLVVALLERYPEIATIGSHPSEGTVTLTFAVAERLSGGTVGELREALADHVRSLLHHRGDRPDRIEVETESDPAAGFVRVTRDIRTFSREELQLLVALLSERFGAALHRSETADDLLDDEVSSDELVEVAIEALREPESQRSLVGFREEARVLVYFVKSRKKAKARAR